MHSVHFLIMYNKLSQTYCISSQQAIQYANADAKMHPDRGSLRGGHKWHSSDISQSQCRLLFSYIHPQLALTLQHLSLTSQLD